MAKTTKRRERVFPAKQLLAVSILTIFLFTALGGNLWSLYKIFYRFVTVDLELQKLSDRLIYLDEVLSMSARMGVSSGEVEWEDRYEVYRPLLEATVRDVVKLAPEMEIKYATQQTYLAHQQIEDLAYEAFNLIRAGQKEDARAILTSAAYQNLTNVYNDGIQFTIDRIDDRFHQHLREYRKRLVHISSYLGGGCLLLIGFWLSYLFLMRKYITERRKSEENMQRFNTELEAKVAERTVNLEMSKEVVKRLARNHELLLKSAGEGIFGLDMNGNMTFMNPAGAKLIGWEPEELIGKPHHKLLHHSRKDTTFYPEEESPIYKALHDGKVHHSQASQFWKKNGTGFPVDYTSTPIKEGQTITGAVVTFRDVADRLMSEQNKQERESLQMKSNFISSVSHELRTPLTAIKESLGIVADGSVGEVNADQKDFIETAKRNVDRLSRLINDVLDFQKMEADKVQLHMREHDLNALVLECLSTHESVMKKQTLKFMTNLDPLIVKLAFDRDYIVQVLLNLVGNAIKFSKAEGHIKVSTDLLENCVKISVQDEGIGIRKEDIPKLFRSFVQIHEGGFRRTGSSGLGLAISKKIVQLHGGRIWVESEYGRGSSFIFTIPLKITKNEG